MYGDRYISEQKNNKPLHTYKSEHFEGIGKIIIEWDFTSRHSN